MAFVAASCGSSGSSKSKSDSSSTGGGDIAEATSAVKTLLVRPTKIPVTTPLDKAVPSGKTIAWLQCSIPDCEILGPPLKAAAETFGWNVNTINAGVTPETVKTGWGLAVRANPDAVAATGFPRSIFESELKTLTSKNVPVVDGFVADTPGNGITAVIGGSKTSSAIGDALASWTLAERGTKANVLLVHSSAFPTLNDVKSGFEARYKKLCADCGYQVLEASPDSFGKDLPAQVVAKLRKNPGINYVVADEGNMLLGLPQAMKTAGITKVPVAGQYPSETSLQYLQDGSIVKALVMPQMVDSMWLMMDALARNSTGQPVADDQGAGPLWIVTPETASEVKAPYALIPGYQAQYKALWTKGISG
jgi:ribose transport system substrate-binding protein